MSLASRIASAAAAIRRAEAIYITAGAGLGVDSGLPDFRGRQGLWREYPPLQERDLDFSDMANQTKAASAAKALGAISYLQDWSLNVADMALA